MTPRSDSDQREGTMLVFDAQAEWAAAGYDQPDGNEQFWHPARILETINGSGVLPDGTREQIATVEWLHSGRKSAGHFVHMMRPLPTPRFEVERKDTDG